MTIAWYNSNELSHIVMAQFKAAGFECRDIKHFDQTPLQPGIFYGILRGSSRAMHILQHAGFSYYYIDNGYFGAQYINADHQKKMSGTFRVVKNDTHHEYKGDYIRIKPVTKRGEALVLPPTPYTAMHHSITVEDWTQHWVSLLMAHGFKVRMRQKSSKVPLEDDLINADMLLSCNSMAAIKAIERGIPAYDTHGLFRDAEDLTKHVFIPELKYDIHMLKAFYEPKQFTLDNIVKGTR